MREVVSAERTVVSVVMSTSVCSAVVEADATGVPVSDVVESLTGGIEDEVGVDVDVGMSRGGAMRHM